MRLKTIFWCMCSCLPAMLTLAITFVAVPRKNPEETVQIEIIPVLEEPVEIEKKAGPFGQVLTDYAVLYSDIEKAQRAGWLKRGELVDIITEGEEWWEVRYEGKKGYISSDCIAKVEEYNKELFERPVVVLDAGHQEKADLDTEPVGPGSDEMKSKVTGGTTGIETGTRESELNLEVALLLEEELEKRGYTVIQVRRIQDVNISNCERSNVANELRADAFIRIHANGSENSGVSGAQTICPAENNPYFSGQLYRQSYLLAACILEKYVEETGCKKEYISERNDMTGINWCKVPVTIIEMGYMTNSEEDLKMQDDEYQKKMVSGIANGIDQYFDEKGNLEY